MTWAMPSHSGSLAHDMGEFVREHAALLLPAEVSDDRLREADLPARQGDRAGESRRRREPHIVRIAGGEAERLEQVTEGAHR